MLTNIACKAATCPPDKAIKRFTDAGGLYLEVKQSGTKHWYLKYRLQGKEKRLAIGAYPTVSLLDARKAREEAKLLIKSGIDASLEKKLHKQSWQLSESTFRKVALEWHETMAKTWSPNHAKKVLSQLEKDLFPLLGNRPITDIRSSEILTALKRVEARGAIETAHRQFQIVRMIWNYADSDELKDINRGIHSRLTPFNNKNFAAITDPDEFGIFLNAIDAYKGSITVKTALQIAPYVFQRPYNLRHMRWADIDFKKSLWSIPSADMKRSKSGKQIGESHLVPLPHQVITMLKDIHEFTGNQVFVFPGERQRSKPISENSLVAALVTLGYKNRQTTHGLRATARTILSEVLEVESEYIESHLAHSANDPNDGAYNRTRFLKQRSAMAQKWADFIGDIKKRHD